MPGTTVQGVPLLVYGTGRKVCRRWVLFICPFRKVTRGRESVLLSEYLEALR